MRSLNADSGGQRGEADVERRELQFDAAFLLLVGKRLPHAERGQVGELAKPDLVVLVVGRSRPRSERLRSPPHRAGIRPWRWPWSDARRCG